MVPKVGRVINHEMSLLLESIVYVFKYDGAYMVDWLTD